jgi:hypothetical protein
MKSSGTGHVERKDRLPYVAARYLSRDDLRRGSPQIVHDKSLVGWGRLVVVRERVTGDVSAEL